MSHRYTRTLIALLLAAAFLFTTGCAVVAPESKRFTQIMKPPAGKSVIYFYRPFNIMGADDIPSIYDNNTKILQGLSMRTYWRYEMEPGEHTFTPKVLLGLYKKDPLTISTEPGEIYYVKMVIRIGYLGFQEISEEEAKRDLQKTFRIDS